MTAPSTPTLLSAVKSFKVLMPPAAIMFTFGISGMLHLACQGLVLKGFHLVVMEVIRKVPTLSFENFSKASRHAECCRRFPSFNHDFAFLIV